MITKMIHDLKKNWIIPACLSFTCFIFFPLVLYLTNLGEYWFRISDFLPTAVSMFCVFFFILSGLVLLLPNHVKNVALFTCFGSCIALYIQGQILPYSYGLLDGREIDWSAYHKEAAVSTALWAGVIAVCLFVSIKYKEKYLHVIRIAGYILIVYEIVNLAIMGITAEKPQNDSEAYISTDGLFEVSSEQNTIVLLLDCYDGEVFTEVVNQYPEVKEQLQGFRFYKDMVGGATRTKYAIPYIISGVHYTQPISYSEYKKEAFKESKLLKTAKEENTSMYLYSEKVYLDMDCEQILNKKLGRLKPYSKNGLTKDFLKMSACRAFPHYLKRFVWIYSGDLDKWKTTQNADAYTDNNFEFYNMLQSDGLELTNNKLFKLIHLRGDHAPWDMNEYAEQVREEETDEIKQARGCMTILNEYLNQMKELGVYDDAAIIIMADHGSGRGVEQNPIFLIKPAHAKEAYSESEEMLSYAVLQDIFAESIKGTDSYPEAYVDPVFPRLFYQGSGLVGVTEYEVKGHAWEEELVEATGNVYEGNSYEADEEYKAYQLGTALSFKEECTGNMYAKAGISGPEMTHTWLVDDETLFKFKLDKKDKNLRVTIEASICGNIQNLIVYANNQYVYTTSFKGGEVSFVIPREYINDDGTLALLIKHPDAILASDGRVLSLSMAGMKIDTTDNNIFVQRMYEYNKDTVIYGENNGFFPYTIKGINGFDGSCAWTENNDVELKFMLNDYDKKSDISILVSYDAYQNNQHVMAYINDTMVREFDAHNGEQTTLDVPHELIQNGVIHLRLEIPTASSPKSNGEGEDTRILGLNLKELSIVY